MSTSRIHDPIRIAESVAERYRQYLQTTFFFRDPELRQSFNDALKSGHLSRGPFLEATPVFKKGKTVGDLAGGYTGTSPDQAFLSALHTGRLYVHQEEAIHKVAVGRNVIVATGTGSGKTEAFLYPILLHLYREFLSGKRGPGVRALVLYPMNALANDQRDRLGTICERLEKANSPFRFTFGQYIGETPDNEGDSRRNAQEFMANRKPGELVLRSEMRKTPPDILLTNYSMLEYLLLRPDDHELFDNGRSEHWKFIVLDEAHQYRGSKGIEMAMLLRRLKQRLREGGRREPFTCIATSATLVGEAEDKKKVTDFAADLFGEDFKEDDLVVGQTESIKAPSSISLSVNEYRILTDCLEHPEDSRSQLDRMEMNIFARSYSEEQVPQRVARILEGDQRCASLRSLITSTPGEISTIADQILNDMPQTERSQALSEIIALLMAVRSPESDAPLLSARYHLFLRSLEGAFVSYWPRKQVSLDRKDNPKDTKFFEVALCRECGQHYFVGRAINGEFQEAVRDPGAPEFGVTFLRPLEDEISEDEDELFDEDRKVLRLCLQCGKIGMKDPECGHAAIISVVKELSPGDDNRADQIARCGACGYTASGRDPVREVVHGTDGPHAVIATTLHETLPPRGKKVLAFADGRQEAAFFAWYLEDSYKDILSRNLIVRALRSLSQKSGNGFSIGEVASSLQQVFREKKILPSSTGNVEFQNQVWRRIYQELLTPEPRISLEGVGLAQWRYLWPEHLQIPDFLKSAPWLLSEQEAKDLVCILLDTMRERFAVEVFGDNGVTLNWADIAEQKSQMRFKIGPPGKKPNLQSWDGKTGKRARFLTKLLLTRGVPESNAPEISQKALVSIWEAIRNADRDVDPNDQVLVQLTDGCRLNPRWYRLWLTENDRLVRCNTCNRLQPYSVHEFCRQPNCRGKLETIGSNELEPNHYRILYVSDLPATFRVEEHTAQLDKEQAREYQRAFRDGRIHLLSCSTTFELGVDLGDLNTIFLRNVPPEAFNYAQRVGRAGRRVGVPGFAITYCRRSPHDIYHFFEPERMMSGKSRPPIISIKNEKIITRHITATALSSYFRAHAERFSKVEGFLKSLTSPSATTDLTAFLNKQRERLEGTLKAIVPRDVWPGVGLLGGEWIGRIAGSYLDLDGREVESSLLLGEKELASDIANVLDLEQRSMAKRDFKTAEWAKRRGETIAGEDVLAFLSRKAIIPKYGFPVDVVELDPQRVQQNRDSSQVLLQRDLSIAISEFAPSNELIANKKKWTSYGLKRVAGKEWPRMSYKRCLKHNTYLEWRKGDSEPNSICNCRMEVREYVIPQFGFITDRDNPKPPTVRSTKFFSTRPYFAQSLNENAEIVKFPEHLPLLTLKRASPGKMVVLCEGKKGKGFYICAQCGAGTNKRVKNHDTPFGKLCDGKLDHVALGHSFITDVLKLQFHPKPPVDVEPFGFAQSLAFALMEGAAEALEVPSNDLSATVKHADGFTVPEIVIYDNVPGGAGLVARLEHEDTLRNCLLMALNRVSGKCGCDSSCYGCLRNYRNQFAHQNLRREPVKVYLERLLENWQ